MTAVGLGDGAPRDGMNASARPLLIVGRTGPIDAVIEVPTSKSVANRMLVCALLADGESTLTGMPDGDDVAALLAALAATSRCTIDRTTVVVRGGPSGGPLLPDVVNCRLAGTTSRFLTAVAALSDRPITIDGEDRLRERPMRDLHDALAALGVSVEPLGEIGHLPVRVSRGDLAGGSVAVRGDASSQFLSALMLVAPSVPGGLTIDIVGDLVSRPYVEMTAAVMAMFGIRVDLRDHSVTIPEGSYEPAVVAVEPDHSSAAFPIAAVLVGGGQVTIPRLGSATLQGDEEMLDIAASMGAIVERGDDVTVTVALGDDGRPLTRGIDVDMASCSDLVPAVAVSALFARSATRIRGVGFIRNKESDRLGDLADELRRAGGRVVVDDDGLSVEPSELAAAEFTTHDDHRLAMALSLVSLAGVDVVIDDAAVVSKSWPGYFETMSGVLGEFQEANYSRRVSEDRIRPVVAAFDFDHTLTVADSVVPFLVRVAGRRRFVGIVARNIVEVVRRAARRDRDGLKILFAEHVFRGRSVEEVRALGDRFAATLVTSRMRADTARRLREHQEAGHVVVLVSASFGEYLHTVGDMLEVDAVLCTELETDGDTFTGRLVGANCRGAEKRERVLSWLAETGLGGESIDHAYGDSNGDVQLLEMAATAVWVGRGDVPALHVDTAEVSR